MWKAPIWQSSSLMGWKRGKWMGMVMVFFHPDQARTEASDALSTFCQHNSSQPSVVVVGRYSNTHYIPRGTSCSLYLDVDIFSWGTVSAQFPLDRLHFGWLLPFTKTDMLLPCGEGEERLGMYSDLPEIQWGEFRGGTPSFWCDLPFRPNVGSSSTPGRVHPDCGEG